MFHTLAYHATVFHRSFAAFTAAQLEALGLHYGALFFILYVGKHPGCTQAQLTSALQLDWGYSQRSILRLVADGFLIREKKGRAYQLKLSPKGTEAFKISHQVFLQWDEAALDSLSPAQQQELFALLSKVQPKPWKIHDASNH